MRLFIAEKHDAALSIADALAPASQQQHLPYHIICGNDAITWANGHLFKQAPPEYYDQKYARWRAEDLPIIPKKLEILPIEKFKDQIATIFELIMRADCIVHACDPDREGQLIGAEILAKAPPVPALLSALRFWPDDLDETGVQEAIAEMRPNVEYVPLMLAAIARAKWDWVWGMNFSRKCSIEAKYAGDPESINVGRVKTPTLQYIVAREREIQRFVPVPYWTLLAAFQHPNGTFEAQWKPDRNERGVDSRGRAIDKDLVEAIREKIDGKSGRILIQSHFPHRVEAPLPMDLTELQMQAQKKAGLTAKETAAAAQSLYVAHRVISYPRTACRYLNERHHSKAPAIFAAIAANDPTKAAMIQKADVTRKSRAFDDARAGKAKSHNAIVPTVRQANLSALSAHEQVVYDLVCRGYVAQFYPPHEYVEHFISVEIAREIFEVREDTEVSSGWKVLFPAVLPPKPLVNLPHVAADDLVHCVGNAIEEKQTEPPRRYNTATLVKEMENVSDLMVDADEETRKRMAAVGLGTVATRAEIIESLIERDHTVKLHGSSLAPTIKGIAQIEKLTPYKALVTPDLTAEAEYMFEQIANGEMTLDQFDRRLEQIVRNELFKIRFDRGAPRPPATNGAYAATAGVSP